MEDSGGYRLVHLASDTYSIHCEAVGETNHPVIGPVAEAEALYVNQLDLATRMSGQAGEFVVWDVGLGSAANALTVIRAVSAANCPLRLVSFDNTLEPLAFSLRHADKLGYFGGYESVVSELLQHRRASFRDGQHQVEWEVCLGDFPSLMAGAGAGGKTPPAFPPSPNAILYDAYSPAKNPVMWTGAVFADLFRRLDPAGPCSLATYSRSTAIRVGLLCAGFFVGAGHATGFKEETTIAANTLDLISQPLGKNFLTRVRVSGAAEPMWEPVYRQAPVAAGTLAKLERHPQFV